MTIYMCILYIVCINGIVATKQEKVLALVKVDPRNLFHSSFFICRGKKGVQLGNAVPHAVAKLPVPSLKERGRCGEIF